MTLRPYVLLPDALLLLALLALPAAAQDAAPVLPPGLPAAKAAALEREIAKLRNNNDAGRAKAEAEVIAYGRGAVPLLVKAGHTVHEGQRRGLVTCLLAVTTDDDRQLVAELLASPHIALRRFAARKAGELRRPELMEPLQTLLADPDEAVRVEAAIALVSNGHEEGLPVAAPAMAGPLRGRVQAALKGVAGKGRHDNVGAMLTIDPQREREEPDVTSKERLAAVDLLHAIGDQTAIDWLVRALDDSHNVVQRNAINALRDLLEQSGPMQGSSVFQQIKEAERIKEVAKQKRA
jgi:hypothetical protein